MAINEKAWAAVKRYMHTHYIGSTGPCCDHCSRALQIAAAAMGDDPEMDCTDFAHPAWWRGWDIDTSDIPEVKDWSGAVVGKFYRPIKEQVCLRLDADVQDGTGELCGICNEPWESLRQRLARLVRSDKLDTNGTGNLRKRT